MDAEGVWLVDATPFMGEKWWKRDGTLDCCGNAKRATNKCWKMDDTAFKVKNIRTTIREVLTKAGIGLDGVHTINSSFWHNILRKQFKVAGVITDANKEYVRDLFLLDGKKICFYNPAVFYAEELRAHEPFRVTPNSGSTSAVQLLCPFGCGADKVSTKTGSGAAHKKIQRWFMGRTILIF